MKMRVKPDLKVKKKKPKKNNTKDNLTLTEN